MVDIGDILFREILKVSAYPGAPFTGNIINDIVLYFFIPTVLLIMVVFVLLGRIAVQQKGLRLLLGVAIYLFVVFSGYFSVFILLGTAYFFLLVFIIGIIYFIPSHFRVRSHGYPGTDAPHRTKDLSELRNARGSLQNQFDQATRDHNDRLATSLQEQINRLDAEIYDLERDHTNPRRWK